MVLLSPARGGNSPDICKIAITSGKGGVGKTLTSINISIALAELGKKTLVLDGDFGLANVDVVLGLHTRYNIEDVLSGRIAFSEVLVPGPSGIHLIPSGSGISTLTQLSSVQRQVLAEEISKVSSKFDYLVVDTGAGISENVLHLNASADMVVVVTTPEPHALTDAYALIKVLIEIHGQKKIYLLANQCESPDIGLKIYGKLSEVTNRFLGVSIAYLGSVPKDPQMQRLVMQRQWHSEQSVRTVSGQAWTESARRLVAEGRSKSRASAEFWPRLMARRPSVSEVKAF